MSEQAEPAAQEEAQDGPFSEELSEDARINEALAAIATDEDSEPDPGEVKEEAEPEAEEKEEPKPEPEEEEKEPELPESNVFGKLQRKLTERERKLSEEKREFEQQRRSWEEQSKTLQDAIKQIEEDARTNPERLLTRAGWTTDNFLKHVLGTEDAAKAQEERKQSNPEVEALQKRLDALEAERKEAAEKSSKDAEKAEEERVRTDYLNRTQQAIESDESFAVLRSPHLRGAERTYQTALRMLENGFDPAELTPEFVLGRVAQEIDSELRDFVSDKAVRGRLSELLGETNEKDKTGGSGNQSGGQKRPKTLTNRATASAPSSNPPVSDYGDDDAEDARIAEALAKMRV